jgi:hypothetical protein
MKPWHFSLIVVGAFLELALAIHRVDAPPAEVVGFSDYWYVGEEECDAIEMRRMRGDLMRVKHTRFVGWFQRSREDKTLCRWWHVEEFWVSDHKRETALLQTLVETKRPNTRITPVFEGMTFDEARSRLRAGDGPLSNCEIPTREEAAKMPAHLRPAVYSHEEENQ